jgi:hypothetical protein
MPSHLITPYQPGKWIFIVEDAKAHGIRKLQVSNGTLGFEGLVICWRFRDAKKTGFSNQRLPPRFSSMRRSGRIVPYYISRAAAQL